MRTASVFWLRGRAEVAPKRQYSNEDVRGGCLGSLRGTNAESWAPLFSWYTELWDAQGAQRARARDEIPAESHTQHSRSDSDFEDAGSIWMAVWKETGRFFSAPGMTVLDDHGGGGCSAKRRLRVIDDGGTSFYLFRSGRVGLFSHR